MTIHFSPQNSGSIHVFEGDTLLYNKSGDEDALENLVSNWDVEPDPISTLRACIIPTDSSAAPQFLKNIFLPTFFNRALTINGFGPKIIAIPFALLLDIATLIPRIVVGLFVTDAEFIAPILKDIGHNPEMQSVRIKIVFKKTIIEGDHVSVKNIEESREVALNPFVSVDRVIKYNNTENQYLNVNGEWDWQSRYDLAPQFFFYKN